MVMIVAIRWDTKRCMAIDVSIFLGLDGTPTRKVGIEWSGTPEQIGYSYPYVIAILPKHVEVRNIQTLTLVQQIDLANTKFLNQGKLVYVASTSQIYRLTPFSFSVQIDQLVEKQEYKEAVSLLDQIDAVLVENKEKKLNTIRTAYAHDLFRCGEYDTALGLFQELDTPAAEVIRLYPEMISGSLAAKHHDQDEDQDEEDLPEDSELLSPGSRKSTAFNDDSNSRPSSRAASIRSKATTVASHQSHHLKKKETVPLTGLNLRDAVSYLIRYLTDKRQKLARRLNNSASLKSDGSSTSGDGDDLLYQASLVDTSLLKSYMMTNDALVGPLLRVQNHCDVEECENILMDKKVRS